MKLGKNVSTTANPAASFAKYGDSHAGYAGDTHREDEDAVAQGDQRERMTRSREEKRGGRRGRDHSRGYKYATG